MNAASRTPPFGIIVRVANMRTRRSVDVRINDRGRAAARALGVSGLARVCSSPR